LRHVVGVNGFTRFINQASQTPTNVRIIRMESSTSTDMELAVRYDALAAQFNALANVANKEVPNYMQPAASTGTALLFGAGAGASMAYFGPKAGVAINAGVSVAALLATVLYGDKPDVRELGHAVARGLGAGTSAVAVYEATHDWISKLPAKDAQKLAAAGHPVAPVVPVPAPPPPAAAHA
jgi:hypothetical protein